MDNQHLQITGYRDLTEDEIELINHIKRRAVEVEAIVKELWNTPVSVDPRWLSIGETQLQQGFMALTRAVAQPESF